MNESRNESKNEENKSDSPPPLSTLSLKGTKKSLGLQLTPTLTTSPATPAREQASAPTLATSPSATCKTSPLKSPLKSPQLPAKLATLSKPTSHSFFTTAFRNRNARHSIDVRTLPSYLAKKRQSTFGQFLTVLNPSAPEASSSSEEPIFEEPIAPTLSLGERVAWVQTSGPEFGTARWIGRMPQITNDWTVGVEFDNCIGTGDGTVEGRRYFFAKENFAKFLPLSSLTKTDNYVGRPRSGTMLSRMSVQLKPGQLISIQRSPSVNVQHCSLNAPHHVGHDVHETNTKHCQCHSCNHPCAHICKTRKPKGRKQEMAHMCHFSSKPHNKMCCGGEDLPCATKPLIPGTSWLHTTDMASFRTVPTEPIPRRKSVTIHDDRNAISAPTSIERKPPPSPLASTHKDVRGSNLSISSLPSSGSRGGYIKRGVLTDESDVDSDTERSASPNVSTRSGGLRSLVSCFINNSSSLRSKKKIKERRKRKLRKQKRRTIPSNASSYERRHRRGLSSDTSYEYDTTHNRTSSIASCDSSSKTRTNPSPVQHKSTSISPPLTHSPIILRKTDFLPMEKQNVIPEEVQQSIDDDRISEGNEGQDGCTSSSKSSGHLITTKADIESTVNHRSLSSPSHSTISDCVSPRRRKKGPAPAPPPTTSTSPTSLNLSLSSSSLPQSPTNTSTPTSAAKRRASYKKNPAPTPPNLTRSMSEQKQLNLKNLINAVPSFRSEVDLQGVSRKSSQFENSLENAETSLQSKLKNDSNNDYKNCCTEVPNNDNKYNYNYETVLKSDASTQISFESDSYEEICQFSDVNCYANNRINEKPNLPKKTFNAISLFGCEVNNKTNYKANGDKHSMSISRSYSMPLNVKRNHMKSANECDLISSDLNALLSPKHKYEKVKAERLIKGMSDCSVTSASTVIEFINALTDLENEINLTDAEHEKQSSLKSSDSKVNMSSETNSDENITVRSMPTKWRYSSSSIDSLSSKSSKTSESIVLPNNRKDNTEKHVSQRFHNHYWSEKTGPYGLHSSASEQSLSSLSSSSTLSVASTIRSSSSTPTPLNQNIYKSHKDKSELKAGKPPKHPIPRPRSKNRNINTGKAQKSSETRVIECSRNSINANNIMYQQPGHSSALNQSNSDTLWPEQPRVTRLMEQLEVAIAHGQHRRAAVLARELAIRKVTCTLSRPALPNSNITTSPIIAYLYIEDRVTHRGPIPLQVYPSMSVNMLKLKVEKEFNIPSEVQKWILGKTLATNSNASLATYGITCSGCPIFLYLLNEDSNDFIDIEIFNNEITQPVEETLENIGLEFNLDHKSQPLEQLKQEINSDIETHNLYSNDIQIPVKVIEEKKPQTYLELVELDDVNCVTNTQVFECPVCFQDIDIGDGIVLRDCLHTFCKFCLLSAIEYNEEVEVKCPFRNDDYSCDSRMQEREVKAVVPIGSKLYERYLEKSVSTAESKIAKSFHCKTADCRGWCEFDDNVNIFECPVCGHENCLNCQAIHEGLNCKQYQDELDFQAAQSGDAKKTKEFLDNMLQNGEALRCPQCQIVLMKKWGCDWVKCSMCETEICWVTKGMRWGPKGRGDTSGGCKCMLNGQRCHPKCKYCH